MGKGILYGVGVGPGDPELMTLKAVRVLREADVIAIPDRGGGKYTALTIARDFVQGKELLRCAAPMTGDASQWEDCHKANAGQICALLDQGKMVAFLTLGDPTVYSSYIYIHRNVLERGYEARIVPGVPSFCAAAARLNTSLCEGEERLLIVPASYEAVEETFDVKANKVYMKAGRTIEVLRESLGRRGALGQASLVENCGMEGERVFSRFAEMEGNAGYYSIVLVKDRRNQYQVKDALEKDQKEDFA